MFDYLSSRWRQVRDAAIIRTEFHCEAPDCPHRFGLHVHHLVSPWRAPALAYQDDNLVVLCEEHHAKRHGYGSIPTWWVKGFGTAANDEQFELLFVESS